MAVFFLLLVQAVELYRVTFRFQPPIPAREVTLAGTFNQWNPRAQPMTDEDGDGVFETTLLLPAGTYQYKFVVDGTRWFEDPRATAFTPDGFGGRNALVQVAPGLFPRVVLARGDGHLLRELVRFDPHQAFYVNAFAPGSLRILVETAPGDVERAFVVLPGDTLPLSRDPRSGPRERFLGWIPEVEHFTVVLQDGDTLWHQEVRRPAEGYPEFRVPSWARGRVAYQVFPDRFRNGNPANDPPGTRPWHPEPLRPPEGWFVFYGGDLQGLRDTLEYLRDLGIGVLYLNPIFASPSNHGYDITDYFQVNPRLGTLADFDSLLATAHRLGIRVVLDGVFNHCSDQHPFFQDVRQRGPASPYYNWFRIKRWPFPERFDETHRPIDYYDCWWGFGSLPKWNHENPRVRAYLLQAAEFWTRRGIDGWRLDVPNEVPHAFWKVFRQRLRTINPELYLVGEIWSVGPEWLQGDEFDALMNYPLAEAIRAFAQGEHPADAFQREVDALYLAYPPEVQAVLFNLLDSHDTPRILTQLGGDTARLRLAVTLQMTLPGVPVVYYGDEMGLPGEKDPDCRRVFPWDPQEQQRGVYEMYRSLIHLRNQNPALRQGDLRWIHASGPVLVFERRAAGQRAVVALNSRTRAAAVALPEPLPGTRVFGTARAMGDSLQLPPLGTAIWLQRRP